MLHDSRVRSKSASMGVRRSFSSVGNVENLIIYPFQVADSAMRMDVHKTFNPFFPISLCWLSLNSQSFVLNVFYTSIIRNAFSVHNCLVSTFSSTFYE